jgi:hypothetical protein
VNPATLPSAMANASVVIADGLDAMLASKVTFAEALEFCGSFRQRGIATFLISGDPDPLCADLAMSGRAFLHVLPSLPPASQATSELLPFFDALGAKDLECARSIARAAPAAWNASEELEEDFAYVSLVISLFLASPEGRGAPDPSFEARLARFEALAEGNAEDEVKVAIIRALVARAGEAFDDALDARMNETKRRYQRRAANRLVDEEEAATSGSLSVEGLALVRLAAALGLEPRADHRLVPSLAFRGAEPGSAGDRWSQPDDD